jgi:hypothetical protein
MIQKIITPVGWPCPLREAPPGPFVTRENPELLCFKSEYHHDDGRVMAFNSAGEFFCGDRDAHQVQPVDMVVEDE